MLKLIGSEIVFALQLAAAGAGTVLYIASFFGRGIEDGIFFLVPAFACSAILGIAGSFRDRNFFLKYWGFGILGLRTNFPLEMFPARREHWLNPFGLCCMALLSLHFFMLVMSGTGAHRAAGTGAELRLVSLMVAFGAGMGALSWKCPPTRTPDQEGRQTT